MNSIIIEGYKIDFVGWFGDYDNCITHFKVTDPKNKIIKETRYITANKKGIARTSVFGMKLKIDLNTNVFI